MTVRYARIGDRDELAELRNLLWPETSTQEHICEVDDMLSGRPIATLPGVTLVAADPGGKLFGFIEVDLRSHADGCNPLQPVGFVEGWFVREEFRGRGIGRRLMLAAEDWARAHGCLEMASDALIDNEISHRAHDAMGFEVVDRCVHFRKNL